MPQTQAGPIFATGITENAFCGVFRSRTQTRHGMTTISLTESFICSTCARALPVTEFRRRSKTSDSRMTKCRQCHPEYERDRRRMIQRKKKGREIQKFATQISRSRQWEKISNRILLMVSRLGGPDRFFELWVTEIERARNQHGWTSHGLRFCHAVFQAHQAAMKYGHSFTETDAEHQADLQDALRQCFLEKRKLVTAAARQAGCRIIWPASDSDAEACQQVAG